VGEALLPALREELGPTLYIRGISETWMPGLELERIGIVRVDDRLGIDRLAVLPNRGAVVPSPHHPSTP
jgi:hypothetical protein